MEDLTTLTSTDTITYVYNNTDWKDQLTSYNGEAITYDAIGNPLSYRGMTLTWQNGRQLTTLSKDGLSASYTYNDAGLRLSKTINGTTTEYYWNGTQLLAQKTGDSWLHFIYDERGIPVGFKDENTTYIYTKNIQGDIISVTDTSNNIIVASYTYDSWGNILTATGTMAEVNPLRYCGYYYDTETSMYYLQSRYYDAEVGRFINADQQINEGVLGANAYAYCENNCVNYYDPDGYKCTSRLRDNYESSLFGAGGIALVALTMMLMQQQAATQTTVWTAPAVKSLPRSHTKAKTLPDTKVRQQFRKSYRLAYISEQGELMKLYTKYDFVEALALLGVTGAVNDLSKRWEYNAARSSSAQRTLEHMGTGDWGIYADSQQAAKALAIVFGYTAPPEVHGSGMYGHYHGGYYNTKIEDYMHIFHIWYGVKLG